MGRCRCFNYAGTMPRRAHSCPFAKVQVAGGEVLVAVDGCFSRHAINDIVVGVLSPFLKNDDLRSPSANFLLPVPQVQITSSPGTNALSHTAEWSELCAVSLSLLLPACVLASASTPDQKGKWRKKSHINHCSATTRNSSKLAEPPHVPLSPTCVRLARVADSTRGRPSNASTSLLMMAAIRLFTDTFTAQEVAGALQLIMCLNQVRQQ